MKISLKIKLIISYVLLSIFLVSTLLVFSKKVLNQRFQNYIIETQETKNKNIVNLVEKVFSENREEPQIEMLKSIGNTAFSQGMVLMVTDLNKKEIFCMSTIESQMCSNMIASMEKKMANLYPGFKGSYEQRKYDIVVENEKVGQVVLGYYGPFYYEDTEIQFLQMLNKVFLGISLLSFVIATMLGIFMASRISKPMKDVVDQTKALEQGNYKIKLPNRSKIREINQLINSINQLAATLQSQQQTKKRMTQDYAHEFRTPLATLQSNLEAMIDGVWEPTQEHLESCREEILRLTRMIAEIDKIVKIEENNLILEKSSFDLEKVINYLLKNLEVEILEKNINVETTLFPVEIKADKDKVMQVIFNLLTNAVKYTKDGGVLQISFINLEEDIEIRIKDNGIGIGEEDLPNIFEHLYRVDKSRTRNTGGSGIGLAVVKAIVEAHGGSVGVKSELEKGSEFIVILPKN